MVAPVHAQPSLHVDLAAIPGQARVIVRLSGPDAARFLQGLLSADIDHLRPGEAIPAALLTVKGKVISELLVLREGDGFVLAIPADVAEAVIGDLDRHIIMDDVTLAAEPGVGITLLWPAGALADEAPAGVTRVATSHPAPGELLIGPQEALTAALGAHPRGSAADFDARRVEAGAPAWGRELRAGFFPPEVGFVGAVSYDKGCYRGQEPLARIHARGQVNRVMVRVRAPAAPEAGDGALRAEGREEAGEWTTWTEDPAGGVIGLAIVHRSLAHPGARLACGAIAVEVTSAALGDDPGLSQKKGSATVQLGRRS